MSQSTTSKNNKMSFDQYHSKLFSKVTNTNTNSKTNNHKHHLKSAITATNKVSHSNSHKNNIVPTSQHFKGSKQSQISNANYQFVTIPISHTPKLSPPKHEQQQSQSSQIKKIDLIFQKQPQQVQNKLRMLLLNYNAVMEYNQSEDKFEVDLLLPFQSVQEQQAFVERFQKTRREVQKQVQKDSNIHQNKNKQYEQELIRQNDQEDQYEDNERQEENEEQYYQKEYKQSRGFLYKQGDELEQSKDNDEKKTEESRQGLNNMNKLQEENNKQASIDYYKLNESLDMAIRKAMQSIGHPKLVTNQPQYAKRLFPNQKEQQSNVERQEEVHDKEEEMDVKMIHSKEQQQRQYQWKQQQQQHQQQASQQQSSMIQQHDHHNIPQSTYTSANKSHEGYLSINNNNQHTIYRQPQSQYTDTVNSPQSTLRMEGVISNQTFNHYYHKKTNNPLYNTHQILIQDQEDNLIEQEQETISLSDDDDYHDHELQDIPIIEQKLEEEVQDQPQFVSPKDYQNFLKKKLNSLAIQNHLTTNRHSPSTTSPTTVTFSSFRKDYVEFLKKNNKRIQRLYLRIGKQLNKRTSSNKNQNRSEQNKKYGFNNNHDDEVLGDFKRRISIENQQMSSEDKVRYFRYLAKNAKRLYIEHIRNQSPNKSIYSKG